MAEFCLECWNRMNEINDSPKKYVLSKELELCEGSPFLFIILPLPTRTVESDAFRENGVSAAATFLL